MAYVGGTEIIASFRMGGGGVASINGLTGAITLAAGSGITLTPSGGTITIAATSSGGITGSGIAGQIAVFSAPTVIGGSAALTYLAGFLQLTSTAGMDITDGSSTGLTISETGTGQLFLRSGASSNGINIENDGTAAGITINNNGGSAGIFIEDTNSSGAGITIDSTGTGSALYLNPSGSPVYVHEISYFPFVLLASSGAVPPHNAQRYIITLASAASLTLAAPTAGGPGVGDDGKMVSIISNTAFAHTLTATGLFNSGVSAAVNLATFAAFKGATIVLMAYQGRWDVFTLNGVVMS